MTPQRPFAAAGALALVLAGLGGCASTDYTQAYQERLVRTLPYPFGVTFSATETFPGEVLCGEYTASEDGGLRTTTGPFIVTPDRVYERPTAQQSAVYCSTESAAELFARTGIGGPDADWAQLAAVRDAMHAIDAAVTRYHETQGAPPRRLDDLLGAGLVDTESALMDPWDRPYVYRPGLSGGTTARFSLRTLGRDGETGGTGADADIDRADLALVEHVLRVRGY